jgi:anti-sigma factor RsiW
MKCAECQELVFEYADNTLPEATRNAVSAHIAGCSACRAFFAQEDSLREQVPGILDKRLSRLKIDAAMRHDILRSAPLKRKALIPFPAYAFLQAAAAVLLVAGIGSAVWRFSTTNGHHEPSSLLTVATCYSDSSKAYWTKKTLVWQKKNGTESYLKIVATRPQRIQIITYKQGGSI